MRAPTISSVECRDNALKCYRLSQGRFEPEIRQELLELVVKWHILADRLDQVCGKPH